jgi:two-component system response regulator FixJ
VKNDRIVYVVDACEDDPAATTDLLLSLGYDSRPISSGLAGLRDRAPGCVLVDIDTVGAGMTSVFDALPTGRADLPVIVISARADAMVIVELMRLGVCDFLVKPLNRDAVAASLGRVFGRLEGETAAYWRRQGYRAKIAALSDREHDILRGLLAGHANKALAYDLGISIRTVEMHRSNMMSKLGVDSLAEAIRLTIDAGVAPDDRDHGPAGRRAAAPIELCSDSVGG